MSPQYTHDILEMLVPVEGILEDGEACLGGVRIWVVSWKSHPAGTAATFRQDFNTNIRISNVSEQGSVPFTTCSEVSPRYDSARGRGIEVYARASKLKVFFQLF